MDFKLKDARPIWQQLADQITSQIVTGAFPPGEHFPSVRDLALQAGVNPNTMQRALAKLEDEALLVTYRASGREVTEDQEVIESVRARLARERVSEYIEEMEKLGYSAEDASMFAAAFRKEEVK